MTDSEPLNVLCVDDDPDVLRVVERVLAGDDRLAVEAIADPQAALDALDGDAYDGVVSDSLRLPNGEPFVEAAREVAPETAVLLFTGSAWTDVAEVARAVDARGVVRKGVPGSFETLRTHLVALDGEDDGDPDELSGAPPGSTGVPTDDLAGSVVAVEPRGTWRRVATHDLSGEEELVVTLSAVIEELVDGPERFEPLYYHLDAESLESFLRESDEGVRVTFSYLGRQFSVRGDGTVSVRRRTAETVPHE